MNRIKHALKQGLIFLLIPGIIIYLILSVVSLLDGLWAPAFNFAFGKTLFWSAGFLATLILVSAAGFILTSKFFQRPAIAALITRLWSKIPIFNLFFGKEFFSKKDLEKMKAVMVEYPSKGVFQIGFCNGEIQLEGEEKMYKILVPTVPIPATGFLCFIKESEKDRIIFLKNPPLEVAKIILSGGFINVHLEKEN